MNIRLNNIYNAFEFSLSVDSLEINLDNITKAMGYKGASFPYMSLLLELYSEAKEIVKPRCGFVRVSPAECNSKSGEVIINGVVFKIDRIIASSLKEISEAAFYVGTVGNEFDIWLEEKQKAGDPFLEYFPNLIGSEIAEGISKWIYNIIAKNVQKEGLFTSNSYSPGYCGWTVSEQEKLFGFFPNKFCNISLTDSALMLPIKSISGLVGIGRKVKWMDYPCEVCNASHCYKNRRSILV